MPGRGRARKERSSEISSQELEEALHREIQGEVRFDTATRALYATDLSIYRQVPIGVVIPRTIEDVIHTVKVCREHSVPILGRGTGTSLSGQTCNVAVVIDFSKYLNRIEEINPKEHFAWVQPGVICDQLKEATTPHGLFFSADPATHQYCSLGGMIGNNSCGAHSLLGGKTVENVEELDILLYDGTRLSVGKTSDMELERIIREGGRRGEIYRSLKAIRDRYGDLVRSRYPRIPRRVSGYNLDELLPENGFHVARSLVGSESTCALVLRAKLRLIPYPAHRALLVIGYPDAFLSADHVPELLELSPIALEAFHVHVLDNLVRKDRLPEGRGLLPEGAMWLLAEFGGDSAEEAAAQAEAARRAVEASDRDVSGLKVFRDQGEQDKIWDIRESGVAASRVPGAEDAWPSWEDTAVAPERLGDYLRDFDRLTKKHDYAYTLYGHFGQGCIHTRITFRLKTEAGVKAFRAYMEEAADLVVKYGGSLNGEHGDGQAKGELLPKMFGHGLMQAFREFKSAWDPDWKMNPGKVIDAYPLDSNLRLGPDYNPKPVFTHFKFPDDGGSLARATERCFGIGKCRRVEGGTMCPSFKVTRDEKHTTRGRAHLLFEMLRGDFIDDTWRDEGVKESLDLCLACKGCKGDCPVSVDIATYKAEFLSHYYEGKPRPRSAYSMGYVFEWARLASKAPRLANLVTRTPGLSGLAKSIAGIAPDRAIPRIASQSFKAWFFSRNLRPAIKKPKVMLWADTFNNYFTPEIGRAAVHVLESQGYEVEVPKETLCCGRPLYDYGFLDEAKRKLKEILHALGPAISEGTPILGLEPSCVSVFRDELKNLFPHDREAMELSRRVLLFSEFLARPEHDRLPKIRGKVLMHGHCHQKAIMGMESEKKVLEKMDLEVEAPDFGCCGMAGSFGFEEAHAGISKQIGEVELLPAVRKAADDTLIVTSGFSCREQIVQGTGRKPLHTAQVLERALRGENLLEAPRPKRAGWKLVAMAGVAIAAGLFAIALAGPDK